MTPESMLACQGLWPDWLCTMPESFATLVSGLIVLIAAIIAWLAVRREIAAQGKIEANRLIHERRVLETGLTAELLMFSNSVVEATSQWNVRALQSPRAPVDAWPIFVAPHIYLAQLAKIGLLSEGWPAAATITFFGILIDLNELASEPISGPSTVGEDVGRVANRLQVMALNLAQALDGLNADRQFPISPTINLDRLRAPDGAAIGDDIPSPASLQALLIRLGSQPLMG